MLLYVLFGVSPDLYNRTEKLYNQLMMLLFVVLDSYPSSIMRSRFILFMDDDVDEHLGRDIFTQLSQRRLQFYDATGETPETFLVLFHNFDHLLYQAPRARGIHRRLNRCNMLLLTLIWLKCYPTYNIIVCPLCLTFYRDKFQEL